MFTIINKNFMGEKKRLVKSRKLILTKWLKKVKLLKYMYLKVNNSGNTLFRKKTLSQSIWFWNLLHV